MNVEIVPILSDNYSYLIICSETKKAAAVDPAQPDPVYARAQELGVDLVAVLNTHHHPDHTAGNEGMVDKGVAKVYGPAGSSIPAITDSVGHGDTITIGKLPIRVLKTPGHTLDGITFVAADAIFTGDALFGGGCGRLFEGDAAMMHQSLNGVLGELPDDTRVYFGHEYTAHNLAFALTVDPDNMALKERIAEVTAARDAGRPTTPSTLGQERVSNPFLRPDSSAIRSQLAARFPGRAFDDSVEVFAALRQLRNDW